MPQVRSWVISFCQAPQDLLSSSLSINTEKKKKSAACCRHAHDVQLLCLGCFRNMESLPALHSSVYKLQKKIAYTSPLPPIVQKWGQNVSVTSFGAQDCAVATEQQNHGIKFPPAQSGRELSWAVNQMFQPVFTASNDKLRQNCAENWTLGHQRDML